MSNQEEIIKGCKAYNAHYQKALYTQYAPAMMSLCVRYSSSRDEAKDLLQEGFIKIYDKIGQYKEEGSFEGWMKRIFVNTAIDYIRKNKNKYFIGIESLPEDNSIHEQEYNEPENSTEEVSYSHEELVAAINAIGDDFKIVFNMFIIENYSHKEIADFLSIKEETSRSRLIRAKHKIKEFLLATKNAKPSFAKK